MGLCEEELVNRIRDGDEEAFIEVLNSYKRKVASLCYSHTLNYHDAEDITQEVFVSLYKSIKNFRGDSSLSTYIYKISLSRINDYMRKRKVKNLLSGLFRENEKREGIEIEDKSFVRDCVLELPKDLRLPVVFYYYIGLNQKEIGEVMGISQRSVEGRIYRAKQKLRNNLERGGEAFCSRNGMI